MDKKGAVELLENGQVKISLSSGVAFTMEYAEALALGATLMEMHAATLEKMAQALDSKLGDRN